MAKRSSIERNLKRVKMAKRFENKRSKLKKIIMNKTISLNERFLASLKLSKVPRNSAKSRVKNRCEITGRSRGYYRKLRMSRIALRKFASSGKIGDPVIKEIERVSRPGRRIYSRSDSIQKIQNGLGISIISTSKGIFSDNEAREKKLGGEVLCKVS